MSSSVLAEHETWLNRDVGTHTKNVALRRRNSPRSPNAEVALYDVTNNRFQTVPRQDAERLCDLFSHSLS